MNSEWEGKNKTGPSVSKSGPRVAQLPLQPPLCRTALAVTVFCPTSAPPALPTASAATRQVLTAVTVQTEAVQGSGLWDAGVYTDFGMCYT